MQSSDSGDHRRSREQLAELATQLMTAGSRYSRSASRRVGSPRSLVALRALSNLGHDGALRVSELALREGVAQPTMTGVINRLEADGLVTREVDPEDARAMLVRATDDGAAELARFRAAAADVVMPLLEELPDADIDVLARAAQLLSALGDRLIDR